MPTIGTRRTLIAMASVTAGVAAATVAPSSAYAAADPAAVSADELKASVGAITGNATNLALPTCRSHRNVVQGNLLLHVPTTDAGDANCQLQNGDFNFSGVKVLQDALNQCNGEHLATDSDYGPLTRDAVKRVQERVGLSRAASTPSPCSTACPGRCTTGPPALVACPI